MLHNLLSIRIVRLIPFPALPDRIYTSTILAGHP
jgi:hypothetical protein